jgi:hypothetical protein
MVWRGDGAMITITRKAFDALPDGAYLACDGPDGKYETPWAAFIRPPMTGTWGWGGRVHLYADTEGITGTPKQWDAQYYRKVGNEIKTIKVKQ